MLGSRKKEEQASEKDSQPSLIVVDAHAMAYRAYYALQGQGLVHPQTGLPTYAIYGFFRMFVRLLLDYQPEYCAVVWDPSGPTFRHEMYVEYKATRKPMPEDLHLQLDEIKALLQEIGFLNLQLTGFEADDVMGTLSVRFAPISKVYLITNDKDCYQLLNDKVLMLKSSRGVSDFTIVDTDWIRAELGIRCQQMTDYLGLVGDSSDNIPGVLGIGPKSAIALLQKYSSLQEIYANLNVIEPKGIRNKLQAKREDALLSKELATIRVDLPSILAMELKQLQTANILQDKILQAFRQQGYNQIYRELKTAQKRKTRPKSSTRAIVKAASIARDSSIDNEKAMEAGDITKKLLSKNGEELSYQLIVTLDGLKKALNHIQNQLGKEKILALDTETDSLDTLEAKLIGLSLSAKSEEATYIALETGLALLNHPGVAWEEACPLLQEFLSQPGIRIVGQNLKYDCAVLKQWGLDLPHLHFDTMIASYLCTPGIRRHNLNDMAFDLLDYEKISYQELVGRGKKQVSLADLHPRQVYVYACEDADITRRLYAILEKKIKKHKLERVNQEIELPLIPVLVRMEGAGVAIDSKYFGKLAKQYRTKQEKLKQKIYELAGHEFNINSTRELQKLLYEDLQLPKGKKLKTGYSTDQKTLENLRSLHPLVEHILEHRKYAKLTSTYIDTLPQLLKPKTNRIHTSFNQTITSTGRLSSDKPNLQNIPIREESGRAIRSGFIANEGNVLLSMDYSQIELRIMAHYSQDPALMEAFICDDRDIHLSTAVSLFGVTEQEVTANMRAQAKAVNFSIIYGTTEFGLAENLRIDRSLAAQYIQRFFEQYPGVRSYMDKTIAFAEQNGYVKTLTGRIRQIADIKNPNHFRQQGAQRTAINTPIQGTSADIIKVAMIDIDNDLMQKKLQTRMILQVHDELLFEAPLEEEKEVTELVRKRMEGAMELRVPLRVDCGRGRNWDEAH